jgi:hypothetical protein
VNLELDADTEEGKLVVAEPRDGGVLIRTAVVLPVEVYTPLCCGMHYVELDLFLDYHAGNTKLERHITRGDPLEGGLSNPSSASHEPVSARR